MNEVISKALCKCENLIVMDDFNIDIKSSNSDKDKLENFCDLLNLTNLVHSETCVMKNRKSIIDLILTNKPLHFQKTHVVETGLSDYHKMISTFFKACSSKLKTKVIYYRSYKKFNESDFLCSLNKANFNFFKNDPNQNYNLLTDKFLGLANKHAPLKKKFVRGNNAPFMNREFQKEIYVRSRLRNKYWVEPSAENKAAYKKQRNKCVKIRRKSIKRYMDKISEKGIETNKSFYYRPVSILNAFSKIYEKVIKNQLASYLDKYFSPFISAYRKSYSTQQVLIRLLEEWREKLDKNFIVGAVLMDLSKAFDCIPHDLIIAKLAAYGFKRETLRLIYSYLKGRKRCVKINNTYSDYNEIISGIPQGLYLGLFSSTFQSVIYLSSLRRPLCIILLMIIPCLPGEKQFPN